MSKPTAKHLKILSIDPWLQNYASDLELRARRHAEARKTLIGDFPDLSSFANGYLYFGIHRTEDGWVYREWAPGADAMHLIGDFNHWNRTAHPMTKTDPSGVWELQLPGVDALCHRQRIKVQVTRNGQSFDRIPLYIRRVIQDPVDFSFCGQVWAPEKPFHWTDGGYGKRKLGTPFIYEAHIGMAQEAEKIGTYDEFTDHVLPRIAAAGYNTIQLMAIMEHPYYASFGYQVSNFFAPSSRFGEPEDLKRLIDTAHSMGIAVLLDLVHSHACPNVNDGINQFDGTETQFFHEGARGNHPAWGTKLFNYASPNVVHFLLSNIKYWLEEYHFDGFRFDGVTSMIYHDHGVGRSFSNYNSYFSMNTDVEAVTYLQLATELIHAVNPFAIAIAEDMSGMPGMGLPIRYGGIGFDYRLGMGLPDYWIKQLKENDDDWDMSKLWYELTTRRPQEKVIGYCESHDQALVGDKTLIFRMADAEMYTGMLKSYHSPRIDRAIALHKLIRFITLVLACNGYLNFMGNEFGHPEWIDFPREGNQNSFLYARRQWSLVDNDQLKYQWLNCFDQAMLRFARARRVLMKKDTINLWLEHQKKLIAFSKGDLVYLFNFHPTEDAHDFFLTVHTVGEGRYRVIFTSDRPEFGGSGRISERTYYQAKPVYGKGIGFPIDIPHECCLVLRKED